MENEPLKLLIGEDVCKQKQLIVIAEDGVIYRLPMERLDQLTDDALADLKLGKFIDGLLH